MSSSNNINQPQSTSAPHGNGETENTTSRPHSVRLVGEGVRTQPEDDLVYVLTNREISMSEIRKEWGFSH